MIRKKFVQFKSYVFFSYIIPPIFLSFYTSKKEKKKEKRKKNGEERKTERQE